MQAVPLAALGLEQVPVLGSQVPATWHWSLGVQTLLAPAWQVPF